MSNSIKQSSRREGFTLLELLVALTILVAAVTIAWTTFSATLNAWRRGGEMTDKLRHGDFVMEQLVSALRSTAYFKSAPDKYGFRLEAAGGGRYPSDKLSWVTSSSAFILPDSHLANALHRLVFSIENNDQGQAAVAIRAYPALADMEEDDVEPWFVSTEVQGVQCRVYNAEDEDWDTEWEDTNSVPSLVEITLFMEPLDEEYGEPVKLVRLVEIPIAANLTNAVDSAELEQMPGGTGSPSTTGTGGRPEQVNPGRTPGSSFPSRRFPDQDRMRMRTPGGPGSPVRITPPGGR